MALAQTTSFGAYILWVETVFGSGTYENVCGLTTRGISRSTAMQKTEVPYCGVGEEDFPSAVEISPQSKEVSVLGSGVMSQQSHKKMWDWWSLGGRKNFRLERVGAASGEIRFENGAGYLSKYDNAATKGEKVSAELEVSVDGAPTVTLAP